MTNRRNPSAAGARVATALLLLGVSSPFSTAADESDPEPREPAPAESEPATDTATRRFRQEITVTGTREERELGDVPTAIDITGAEELATGRREGLDAYLNEIPGVFAPSNDGGSDVKLSIRGFGARSTFGVRDVLVLIDGISITDADGFTRLDQIDLAAAERIEVVKGPASALYGNAAFGGVVNVITRHGEIQRPKVALEYEGGDLGFAKAGATVSGGSARRLLAFALHLSDSRLDGFRDHNETETGRFNGSIDWFASDRTTAQLMVNLSQMRDEIPGSLNREQFETDPTQVRPFFQLFDWRRDDDRYRAGVVLQHQLSEVANVEGRLFALSRDLDHPIFQVIDQEGRRLMGGARYTRALELGGRSHRLTLGVDADREAIDNRRFVNSFGQRGTETVRADETIENYGAYVQDEIALAEAWTLTLGGRFDSIRFEEIDLLAAGEPSSSRRFERFSPKLGLLWRSTPNLTGFVNLATAFQVPTKSELTAAVGLDSGFNLDLEPQVAEHVEVGLRGRIHERLRFDLSLFQTDVEDEILPRTRIENTTIFGNVGEARHRGAEIALDLLLPASLELSGGYAWSENEFTDFGDSTGNALPGHPEHKGFVRLATRRDDYNASLRWERTGSVFLNDTNLDEVGPYSTLSASLSYDFEHLRLYVHGTNLTDELYSAWVTVNDPFGNFFLPSPGRSITGGARVRF